MVSDQEYQDLLKRVKDLEEKQYSNLDIEALVESIPASMIVPPVRTKNVKIMVDDLDLEPTDTGEHLIDIFVNKAGDTMTGPLYVPELHQTSIWHAYGGFQDQSETLAINATTWTHVTNSTKTLWKGTEADGMTLSNDEMVIANAGDYAGTMSVTFEGDNTKDYLFRIYNVTRGEQAGYRIGATGLGSSNYANVCVPIYLEVEAGDHFQFQVYQASGSDATFLNAIFYMSYLHD